MVRLQAFNRQIQRQRKTKARGNDGDIDVEGRMRNIRLVHRDDNDRDTQAIEDPKELGLEADVEVCAGKGGR